MVSASNVSSGGLPSRVEAGMISPLVGDPKRVREIRGPLIAQYNRDREGVNSARPVHNQVGVLADLLRQLGSRCPGEGEQTNPGLRGLLQQLDDQRDDGGALASARPSKQTGMPLAVVG
jgi:hypothetical protein